MTMTWIAGGNGSGSSGAFFFNNIPQTFTHLQLRISVRSREANTVANLYMAGGPSSHYLQGDGASATSAAQTGLPYQFIGSAMTAANATANIFTSYIIDVLDYKDTNKFKTTRFLGGWDTNGAGRVTLGSGLWNTTSALTGLWVDTESGFHAGSRFDLYGITTSEQTGA